jgi:hypothetical protein
MTNIIKFGIFLLKKYKREAVYWISIGIIFAIFGFFVILDALFRPWSLDPVAYGIIDVTLIAAGILVLTVQLLKIATKKPQNCKG